MVPAQPADDRPRPPDLAALYRDHAGFVWRSLRRFGVPEHALEDLVHDTFIIARRRLPELDDRGAPTTWLFVIARNVAANSRRAAIRSEKRAVHAPVGAAPLDPAAALERKQALATVAAFLGELDDDQREVFELVDIEGLRSTEVAELLGANLNVVYSRLRLARRRFESFLERRRADAMRPGGAA
jgi:RNA polymerase sigma-70 factor (ECF subfamily)